MSGTVKTAYLKVLNPIFSCPSDFLVEKGKDYGKLSSKSLANVSMIFERLSIGNMFSYRWLLRGNLVYIFNSENTD